MSKKDSHIVPLYTKEGTLHGILLSPEIWERAGSRLTPILEQTIEAMYPTQHEEPMEDWQMFKDYWDFKYPFNAEVECQCCGAKVDDWEHDPEKTFRLKNASLSGLLVFHCNKCNASVRKKHFKDHICYEVTPCPLK